MPLGLAKDSMLNLAELASKNDDEMIVIDDDDKSQNNEEEIDNASFTKQIINSKEGCENEQRDRGNSNNEADDNDNDMGTSMVEAVQAPIHPKIASDETQGTDNNSTMSPSVHSNSNNDDNPPSESKNPDKNTKIRTNSHQYAGFQADYYDFENYTLYDYPGDGGTERNSRGRNNNEEDETPWWQCIFPWMASENDRSGGREDSSGTEDLTANEEEGPLTKNIKREDDEISMISSGSDNVLGDRLSPRDRQALLARLRLAEPEGVNNDDGAGDSSIIDETPTKQKGILKSNSRNRYSRNVSTRSKVSDASSSTRTQKSERRSLFPAYEPKITEAKKNLRASFSPMARVVTIKSSKEMDKEEKSQIWWQKGDYDEFRKTGRMISKVMLQGGSEIWLATNQSWQLPNQGKAATLRRAMANVDNEDASEKWWHKFGHSRRGLEHIASIDEGRQRQANVRTSIRSILTEQRRQQVFHREDPEKLRMCSIQNTSWAKDLALASGASDADAVTKNFDDESRKSREFYLLKFSRAGKLNSISNVQRGTKQVVPAFMKPMISMQLRPNPLDANTTSRLKFKKKEDNKASRNQKPVTSDLPVKRASNSREVMSTTPAASVPIHDPTANMPGRESLASKAAGFANGEEAVSMSAVLTGMGAIPKSSDATRSRPVLA